MQLDVAAVLLDIDGTLVSSIRSTERSWSTWAARYGVDIDDVLRICHGRRTEDTVAALLPTAMHAQATADFVALELADLRDVHALPGSRSLLASLPRTQWAAVTSGSHALMRARLQAARLPVPNVLIAAEDVSVGKPSPQGYELAAAALDVPPRRCLVIEDSPVGIDAGLAAGATVLAVATSHDPQDLAEAHEVIHDLRACRVSKSSAAGTITVRATA